MYYTVDTVCGIFFQEKRKEEIIKAHEKKTDARFFFQLQRFRVIYVSSVRFRQRLGTICVKLGMR